MQHFYYLFIVLMQLNVVVKHSGIHQEENVFFLYYILYLFIKQKTKARLK